MSILAALTEFNEMSPFIESLKSTIMNSLTSIDYITLLLKLFNNDEESNLTKLSIFRVFL